MLLAKAMLALAMAGMVVGGAAPAQEATRMRVGSSLSRMPWGFSDADHNPTGVDVATLMVPHIQASQSGIVAGDSPVADTAGPCGHPVSVLQGSGSLKVLDEASPDCLAAGARRRPLRETRLAARREAIARALAMAPGAMLFDEPAPAPDPETVQEVLDVIGEMRQSGMTLLIAPHEVEFARHASDWTLFMAAGRIVARGPSGEVPFTPKTERCRRFLSGLTGRQGAAVPA